MSDHDQSRLLSLLLTRTTYFLTLSIFHKIIMRILVIFIPLELSSSFFLVLLCPTTPLWDSVVNIEVVIKLRGGRTLLFPSRHLMNVLFRGPLHMSLLRLGTGLSPPFSPPNHPGGDHVYCQLQVYNQLFGRPIKHHLHSTQALVIAFHLSILRVTTLIKSIPDAC